MVTAQVEKMVRELAVGGKINLETLYLKGEERGILRTHMAEAVGRLASEGSLRIKKGVVEVV